MAERRVADPIERIVAEALSGRGVGFVHESEDSVATSGLDFFLTGVDVFIECKAYHTLRIAEQLGRQPNVIVIQGRPAAVAFAAMLSAGSSPARAKKEPSA